MDLTSASTGHSKSHLLSLPLELQFSIYELALISPFPLLLNCPCNSSFRGRASAQKKHFADWSDDKTHPPVQPALTRTSRFIRSKTLPVFYGSNVFRACYCHGGAMTTIASRDMVEKWLRMIGVENREKLQHFYFYDRNETQDRYGARGLKALKDSPIFTEMGGRLETFSGDDCCAHLVCFGDRVGNGQLAKEKGVPRLRMEDET